MPAAVERFRHRSSGACGMRTTRERIAVEHRLRQPVRLVAEDQPVAVAKIRVPERSRPLLENIHIRALADRREERRFVIVHRQLQPRPIVHRAAAELLVAQHEPSGRTR